MASFLDRIRERFRAARAERDEQWKQMSDDERRFMSESVEDRQADEEADVHLGGADPRIEE
jgi:hypothetical protein